MTVGVGVSVSVGVGVAVRVGVSVAVGVEVGVGLGVPVAVGDAVGVEVGLGEATGRRLGEGVTGVGSDRPHPAADRFKARTRTVPTRFQALATPPRPKPPGQGKALIPSPGGRSPPGDPSRTAGLHRVKAILQR